ncbi:hypothetical protein KY317_04075 [Candidatus Woesearchaeota archaeon]|nr:hypothetical protein [Candidatus Woesearchaeota archaeon]
MGNRVKDKRFLVSIDLDSEKQLHECDIIFVRETGAEHLRQKIKNNLYNIGYKANQQIFGVLYHLEYRGIIINEGEEEGDKVSVMLNLTLPQFYLEGVAHLDLETVPVPVIIDNIIAAGRDLETALKKADPEKDLMMLLNGLEKAKQEAIR